MKKKGFTLIEVLVTAIIGAIVLLGVSSAIVFGIRITQENYINSRIIQMTSLLESVVKNDIRTNAKLEIPSAGDIFLKIYSSKQGLLYPVVEYKKEGTTFKRGTGDGSSAINNFRNFISSSSDKEKVILDLDFNNTTLDKTDIEYSITIQKLKNSTVVKEIGTGIKTLRNYNCRTKLESI